MENKKFIYTNAGDTIYYIKLENYNVSKQNGNDLCVPLKVTRVGILSDTYLDITLENGNTFFPDINKKTLVSTTLFDGNVMHRIYGTSMKETIEAANDVIIKRIKEIRTKIDDLKNEEVSALDTIGTLLIEKRKKESIITIEEAVTIAL